MGDEMENKRIDDIILSMESKYPKSTETEKTVKELYEKIMKLNNSILTKGKLQCKSEYEELSKYATINADGLDIKPNADENALQKSVESFQNCIHAKNTDFTNELQNLDSDFIKNNEELNSCIDRSALNSKVKSNADLENSFYNCFKIFEGSYSSIAQKYNNSINKFDI